MITLPLLLQNPHDNFYQNPGESVQETIKEDTSTLTVITPNATDHFIILI